MGDCILTLPVLSFLRNLYPECAIDVLGNAAMRETAALSGIPGSLYDIDNPLFLPLYTGSGNAAFDSFICRYNHVYIFSAADPEPIKQRVLVAGVCHCFILDPRPPSIYRRHITRHLLSICDEFQPTDEPVELSGPCVFPENAQNGLLIHPGSGSPSKNWPPDRFRAVIEAWEGKCTVLLGPAECERGIAGVFDGTEIVTPGTVDELCRTLMAASWYLGNDSGVSHCTAWCRTSGVVMFGPTDPDVWRPLGDRMAVIRADDKIMDNINVNDVLTALRMCAASV